ncbi:MAG: magnesium transporter [Gammaproteobacteria bacterium]
MTAMLEQTPNRLKDISAALHSGTLLQSRLMLNGLHPAEIASLLESLPLEQRELVWELVDAEHEGDVLLYVNDAVRANLIRQMETHELVAAAEGLATDDLADILQDLPETVIREVLQSMDAQDRQRLESVMSYPEDTAGGLMNTDTITLRADVTIDVVLRYLRRRGELPETTDKLFVVNRDDKYQGLISLTDLLTHAPTMTISEIMRYDNEAIPATLSGKEVANLFQQHDLVSAPVIDTGGRLLGRITIDDVVDLIRDEAERSVMNMAGLPDEQDMFAPVITSTRRRAVWLGVNLLTALFASWVIGLFDATIEKMVALAILMPVVASMGGVAGTQTQTLVIRGMALGQIGGANARRLLTKELAIGAMNGLIWAVVLSLVTTAWFDSYQLGAIIGAAIIINLIFAALVGVSLPLLLRKLGIDPALAGGVVLTTFTDVIGFIAFLGLATIFLI